nr:zinc finger protein 62 homolog isoform X2 [Helicoverpa armigera]
MMEFDEIVVKESPGLCRCCLSEGCYKDLGTEYTWMNETEVYADMLLECFDVSITQHNDGPNGPNRLICEVCITRLRDACNFKKQVLDSEKKFIDMMGRGEFRPKMLIYQAQMKCEDPVEAPIEEADIEYLEDDIDFTDVPEELIKDETEPSVSDITVSTLPVKGKRGRPRKNAVKPEKRQKLDDKPKTSKAVAKDGLLGPYEGCTSERRRKNMKILFNHTSIIPFKWRGKYICFYCGKNSTEYTEFRKHTKSHGLCSTKDYSLKLIKGNHIEIKIDVSEISCEVCNEPFKTFDSIIDHLISKHNMEYERNIDTPFQEYRLADCRCLHCEEQFSYFGYLVKHVNNVHPQKCFICDDCGLTFNKKRDLAVHLRNYHKTGGYPCNLCLKNFKNNLVLRRHQNNSHFRQCMSCGLRFASLSLLQKHIVVDHPPNEDNMKCSYCSKEFHSSIGLMQHLSKCKVKLLSQEDPNPSSLAEDSIEPKKKQNVLQIRQNIQCVLNMSTAVPFKFFSKFSCFYCSKKFVEFDELRQHTAVEHPVCDLKSKCMKKCKGERISVKIDVSDLACKVCGTPMANLEDLITHLIESHKAKYDTSITGCLEPYRLIKDSMPCPICPDAVFRYFGILLRHMSSVHSNNNRICDFCGRSFRNAANLNVHITYAHTGSCECDVCGAKYKNQWCLARHRARTHNAKDHKCPKCPEKFQSQYHTQKHLIKIHNIGHKCSYCGKMFTRNSFMKDHVRRTHLKEKNIPCSICNEKFFDNYLLKMHMVKHEGDRKFTCTVCGKAFLRRSSKFNTVEDKYKKMEVARKLLIKRRNVEYVLQYSNVTPFMWHKGKYKCFYCNETTKDPVVLREHTAEVHQFANLELVVFDRTKNNRNKDAAVKIDVTGISCKLCPQAVTNLEELIHHLIIAHDAEYDVSVPNCLLPFKLDKDQPTCPTCNTKFVFFEYLLRHANKHHLSHHYICDVCGTSFQGENHLKMHYRYYHREGGYTCEYCGISLATLSKKILHEKNVHLVNLSTCPHCPETFKSPYLKKLHLANVHGVEELKIKCPYCPKVYPQESIMSRHMRRVHLREKNVECEVCGDKFFGPYDVKLHMVKHNGEKKFVCSVCGKKFSKRSNLNSHAVLHTRDKDYVCMVCNKAFAHQTNLRMHIRNRHSQIEEQEPIVNEIDDNDMVQMEIIQEELEGEVTGQYIQ